MAKRKTKILSLAILMAIAPSISIFQGLESQPVTATSPFCISDKCKEAEAAEAEAKEKAAGAAATAQTLEGEVARLSAEIAAYEARIATNEAIANDLATSIKENEEKLNLQQNALANMLVDMHFNGQPEAIMILAGSNSISDYAEKQSRFDTVKAQINLSSQAIKSLKEELEKQKKEVDRIIADQKVQRQAIADRRNQQAELVAKYRNNAQAYTAEAEEARRIKEAEIRNYISTLNNRAGGTAIIEPGLDSYPFKGQCPGINWRYTSAGYNSVYGGYYCECTSYAGWKTYEYWGFSISGWGDASSWGATARNYGLTVDGIPAPHTVGYNTNGTWGHVVWIERVNSNGTIDYSEYNGHNYPAGFSYVTGASPNAFRYIHFD